jgi:Fic family protein
MSAQIRSQRDAYYDILEATQKGSLDITAWLRWFLDCLDLAFDRAETILGAVLAKARFWQTHGLQLSTIGSARWSIACSTDSKAS